MDINPNSVIPKKFETSKVKLKKIYDRIPVKVLKKRPEIEKLIFPEPLIIYEGISKIEKPEKIKIPKGISEQKEKKLLSLDEFKEMIYNFNKQEKIYLKNEPIKKENEIFCNNYQKLLKQKNKFSTGTYLDQEYLVPIANRYAQRGTKIPKISSDKNIFKSNPLILSGVDLENYFLYNLGNKYKSSIFLNKVDDIVERKLRGNYVLSDEEMRRLEFLKENEKPKGYIPLEELIPKLKDDIAKTQNTIDNLENKNNVNEVNKNDNNNNKDEINNRNSERTRNIQNNNNNNNIYNYSTNMTNSSRKIKLKKSLSLVNYNKFSSRINSGASTKEQNSQRFSVLNPQFALPRLEYIPKSNINSAVSRDKSRLIFPVKIEKKNILNYLKQKLLNNDNVREILSGYNRISNTIETENINTINSINSINSVSKGKKILKRSLKSINSNNSLTTIRKNSIISAISKESKKNLINLNKELPTTTNIENISINNNNSNNNKVLSNIFRASGKKRENKRKHVNIEVLRREENYKKCESIFNSILEGKFESNRSKSVLSEFLLKRGYKSIKKFSDRDNVLNINRIRNKSIERNYILEEYKIRSTDNGKSPFTAQQQEIINKNDDINKKIEGNEFVLKKLICEKNIDKESFNDS